MCLFVCVYFDNFSPTQSSKLICKILKVNSYLGAMKSSNEHFFQLAEYHMLSV